MKNDPAKSRSFGYTVGTVLGMITLYQYFKHGTINLWIISPAIMLVVLAVLRPGWLAPVALLWYQLGHWLGIINSMILLSAVYFLVLTPVSLLLRWRGKDTLKLKKKAHGSYWQPISEDEKNDMHLQY